MVYPSGYDETGCLYGTNTITFYFENEGVVGGDGYVYTYESPSGAAFSSVSTSSSNISVSPMDEAGTLYTGWEKGSKVDVCFSETFESGKNYYVLLDPGAFRLNEHLSKSITNASLITFRVKDYGFEPFSTEISNGETFSADVKLGGEATGALCEVVALSKGGELTENKADTSSDEEAAGVIGEERLSEDGTYSPDRSGYDDSAVALRISYLNDKGQTVDSYTFVVTIGNPSAEDLVKIRSCVYGDGTVDETYAEGDDAGNIEVIEDELSEISENEASLTEGTGVGEIGIEPALGEDTSDNASIKADEAGTNFKSASVSEHIHKAVDSALKGKELSGDEKGALIVETLNTLAEEGFVEKGTPMYDKNSGSVTYVDANGKREYTRL